MAEAIREVDLRTLSVSQLRSMSLASAAPVDSLMSNSIMVPAIDRTLFNESAGSRCQTYLRERRSMKNDSSSVSGRRRRYSGLLPSSKTFSVSSEDHELTENKSIVQYLKQLLGADSLHSERPSTELVDLRLQSRAQLGDSSGRKQAAWNNDHKVLATADHPYADVLRLRTAGMESEAELLVFLQKLGGKWASRRKKRKIVEASEFGDALPTGWKLLVGIKRKGGRVSLYCRRYISPDGQQFISCKEAASHLRNHHERLTTNHHCHYLTTTHNNDVKGHLASPAPTSGTDSDDAGHQRHPDAFDGDRILTAEPSSSQSLFNCRKCGLSFNEKDSYLDHLLSTHQKQTRKYRLGTSVADGVIIRPDGKYECQFCHKYFDERRRYNGHVGVHVRNYVRGSLDLPPPAPLVVARTPEYPDPLSTCHLSNGSTPNEADDGGGDELGLDDFESLKFSFMETDEVSEKTDGAPGSLCVWCRTVVQLDSANSTTPSDAIGFTCAACTTNISGHFSALEGSMPPSDTSHQSPS